MDKGRFRIPYVNFAHGNEIQMIADARELIIHHSSLKEERKLHPHSPVKPNATEQIDVFYRRCKSIHHRLEFPHGGQRPRAHAVPQPAERAHSHPDTTVLALIIMHWTLRVSTFGPTA